MKPAKLKLFSLSPLAVVHWPLADYGHRLRPLATRLASARLDHSLAPACEITLCICQNVRSAVIGESESELPANVAWSGLSRRTNRETVGACGWD
jgi:hypothetical protein